MNYMLTCPGCKKVTWVEERTVAATTTQAVTNVYPDSEVGDYVEFDATIEIQSGTCTGFHCANCGHHICNEHDDLLTYVTPRERTANAFHSVQLGDVPAGLSVRDAKLDALARRYHEETEAYDRSVCTGPIANGSSHPANSDEYVLTCTNASDTFLRICGEAIEETGATVREFRDAVLRVVRRGCNGQGAKIS